nr:M42 family metallopeptidase [uncultured Flavonifractor sp.]
MEFLEIMQKLNACHGPSGDEGQVAAAIREMAQPYVDEITTDVLGNLICHKKGSGPKVMFAAHMDSIGFIITHIDDNGYLRFGQVGGLSAHDLPGTPVRFRNGTRGVVAVQGKVEPKDWKLDHLYIDIGAKDRAEASTMVQVGDMSVFDTVPFVSGGKLFSPYLDDRIACAILLSALERIKRSDNDLYFVFTVQEEVGLRGARTAAYGIDPDYGIAVDVTDSDDIPDAPHECSSAAGKGAAIKVMDNSVICHPAVVKTLEELAVASNIPYQLDILRFGGTDAGAIHQSRAGVYTGGISAATRYVHTPLEVADLEDIEACAALAAAFAQAKLEG